MAHYHPLTGHTTSPHASALEDVDLPRSYYLVQVDLVQYGLHAEDAFEAERIARRLYREDTGLTPSNVTASYAPKQYKEL